MMLDMTVTYVTITQLYNTKKIIEDFKISNIIQYGNNICCWPYEKCTDFRVG